MLFFDENVPPRQKLLIMAVIVIGFVAGGAALFESRFVNTGELAALLGESNRELGALRDELGQVRIETETLLQSASEATRREVNQKLAEEAKKLASVEEKLSQESLERNKAELQIRALTGLSESQILEL